MANQSKCKAEVKGLSLHHYDIYNKAWSLRDNWAWVQSDAVSHGACKDIPYSDVYQNVFNKGCCINEIKGLARRPDYAYPWKLEDHWSEFTTTNPGFLNNACVDVELDDEIRAAFENAQPQSAVTEDQFVERYRGDIDKPYYVPTVTEVRNNPVVVKIVDYVKRSLVAKLIAFILVVLVIGVICLTIYGMSKMGWDEWKAFLAVVAIPIVCILVVGVVA